MARPSDLVNRQIVIQSWRRKQGPLCRREGHRRPSLPVAGRDIMRPGCDLWKVYVFDLPDAMRVVAADDLPALKLDPAQLDVLAMDNLGRRLASFPHEPVEPGSPVQVLHLGDSYEASHLLLHDRWPALKGSIKGDLLVSAPTQDYVYFVGSGETPEPCAPSASV
jgi:hypothetical protein